MKVVMTSSRVSNWSTFLKVNEEKISHDVAQTTQIDRAEVHLSENHAQSENSKAKTRKEQS